MNRGEEERRAHNRRQAESFDQSAALFEQPIPEDVQARMSEIVADAEVRPGSAVLDVGTGTGALLPYILAYQPSRVVACDLSTEMLRRAWLHFSNQVHFLQMDIVDVPAEEGPFDIVFINACFGNMYDQRLAVEAVARLLKPSGRMIVSHPMGRKFVEHLRKEGSGTVLHDLPTTANSFHLLLAGTGLSVASFRDDPLLYLAVAVKED